MHRTDHFLFYFRASSVPCLHTNCTAIISQIPFVWKYYKLGPKCQYFVWPPLFSKYLKRYNKIQKCEGCTHFCEILYIAEHLAILTV